MTATVKRVERYTPLRRHLDRLRLHACGTAARGPFRMTAQAELADLTRAAAETMSRCAAARRSAAYQQVSPGRVNKFKNPHVRGYREI